MKNILFFTIALFFSIVTFIDSNLLSFFGVPRVLWNFEFTKVTLINIFIPLLSIYFLIKNFKQKIYIPKIVFVIFGMFLISSFLAEFPFTNIFWNNIHWHWLLLFSNLIIFFTILLNFEKNKIEKTIKYITFLSPIVFFLYILENINTDNFKIWFYDYPNYLALYSLMILPFILKRIWFTINYYLDNWGKQNKSFYDFFKWKYFYIIIFILLTISLFLTKITLAIIIYLLYLVYFFSQNSLIKEYKKIFLIFWGIFISFVIIYILTWLQSDIQSFISKYFIWESSFKAFSGDFKNIVFWVWNDSLWYKIEWFKSPFLYIFEWFNLNIQKPNNFILYIFYSFWFLGFAIFLNCFYDFIANYQKKSAFYHIITIFLIFCFFNYASAVNYFFLVIIIPYIVKRPNIKNIFLKTKVFFIILWIFSIIASLLYYKEETFYFKSNLYISNNFFYKKLKLENYKDYILNTNTDFIIKCEEILKKSKSVENYFYCWDMFSKNGFNSTWEIYYKKWLKKLPNLRNKDSIYFKNIFIKYLYSKENFFYDKLFPLNKILKKVNIENNLWKNI